MEGNPYGIHVSSNLLGSGRITGEIGDYNVIKESYYKYINAESVQSWLEICETSNN